MKKKPMPRATLPPELRQFASQLAAVTEQARAAGIFVEDRELLACPGCGLMEDVECGGRLITCREIGGEDTGLCFAPAAVGGFRCPACGEDGIASPSGGG